MKIKNLNKLFSVLIVVFLLTCFLSMPVFAQENGNEYESPAFYPQVQIPNPNSDFIPGQATIISGSTFATYIIAIYNWGLRAVLTLAIIVIIVSGFQWMVSTGNASKIGQAKERIISALIGVMIALGSFFLLNFINPSLTRFRDLNVAPVVDLAEISNKKCGENGICIYGEIRENEDKSIGQCECKTEMRVQYKYKDEDGDEDEEEENFQAKKYYDCGKMYYEPRTHIGADCGENNPKQTCMLKVGFETGGNNNYYPYGNNEWAINFFTSPEDFAMWPDDTRDCIDASQPPPPDCPDETAIYEIDDFRCFNITSSPDPYCEDHVISLTSQIQDLVLKESEITKIEIYLAVDDAYEQGCPMNNMDEKDWKTLKNSNHWTDYLGNNHNDVGTEFSCINPGDDSGNDAVIRVRACFGIDDDYCKNTSNQDYNPNPNDIFKDFKIIIADDSSGGATSYYGQIKVYTNRVCSQ
ncbi:hypothetical protein ISS06_01355 [Patescibacteria group bacterium]|nr:hypothetical protein [Patescibacteria group bacterium]